MGKFITATLLIVTLSSGGAHILALLPGGFDFTSADYTLAIIIAIALTTLTNTPKGKPGERAKDGSGQ